MTTSRLLVSQKRRIKRIKRRNSKRKVIVSIKTTMTVRRVRKKMMILVFLQVREKQRIRSQLKRRRKLSIRMAQSR